jgi:hypothetical protein
MVNPNDIFNNDTYPNTWAPSLKAPGVDQIYGSVSSRCYGVYIGGLLVLAQTTSCTRLVLQVDEWVLSTHMTQWRRARVARRPVIMPLL